MAFEVSPRKGMAMGKQKSVSMPGNEFGVASYDSHHGGIESPDRGMSHAPMDDGERSVGMPVGANKAGRHGMQAHPDHGHEHMHKHDAMMHGRKK